MSVLSASDIRNLLYEERFENRLVVSPLDDPSNAIGTTSIDVRLGNQFLILKRHEFSVLNPFHGNNSTDDLKSYYQRKIVSYDKEFYLHPQELVLGCTYEYVKLPKGVMAYVIGKSSLGRTGLIIATATKIDPGFCGVITLEIINEGGVPLALKPKNYIAQLVFHKVEGNDLYTGRYKCPIGPQYPNF